MYQSKAGSFQAKTSKHEFIDVALRRSDQLTVRLTCLEI